MQTIIWAFGATLILMLIIAFLPIGFTLRGKLSVVVSSFVLALVGLAAVASFSLWQTSILVLLLVLVVAYIMDSRFGTVMYNQVLDSLDKEFDEESETFVMDNKIEKSAELELLDSIQVETALAPLMNEVENKDISIEVQPQNEEENENVLILDELIESEVIEKKELNDDSDSDEGYLADIESLLLAESGVQTESEDEANLYELDEYTESEAGYLSDIESLLFVEYDEKSESDAEGWLEELNELTIVEEETVTMPIEENQLDELFLAIEEAAAGDEAYLKNSNMKKEVKLEK